MGHEWGVVDLLEWKVHQTAKTWLVSATKLEKTRMTQESPKEELGMDQRGNWRKEAGFCNIIITYLHGSEEVITGIGNVGTFSFCFFFYK